jgi:hypothetical protein
MIEREVRICERWTLGDVTVGHNESVIAEWSITVDGDRTLLTPHEFITLYRCMKEALKDAD